MRVWSGPRETSPIRRGAPAGSVPRGAELPGASRARRRAYHRFRHLADLRLSEIGVNRQGQHLVRGLLSHRKIAAVITQVRIRRLQVNRYRIVDACLDAEVREAGLDLVASGNANRVAVPHVP